MSDIIEKMDAWLSTHSGDPALIALLHDVRDEIMALREGLMTEYGARLIIKVREDTLEEAAEFARPYPTVAAGILALKSRNFGA